MKKTLLLLSAGCAIGATINALIAVEPGKVSVCLGLCCICLFLVGAAYPRE